MNTFVGNRDTDGFTFTNGMRLIATISGILALFTMLWVLPTWVSATDAKLERCSTSISKLEDREASIQALIVDIAVTKSKVNNLSDTVDDIKEGLSIMSSKQDKLIEILLDQYDEQHEN